MANVDEIELELAETESEEKEKRELRKPNTPLLCTFLILSAAVLPFLILYAGNIGDASNSSLRFLEFLLPMGILAVVAFVLFGLGWLILRNPLLSALCSAAIVLLAMNFHLLRALFALFTAEPVTSWLALALWLILLVGVLFLLIRLRKASFLPQIAQILCIVMAVLMLFNAVQIAPSIMTAVQLDGMPSQSPHEKPVLVSKDEMQSHTVAANGRNLYWILLDEYADAYTMEQYFGVDSSAFIDYLEEKGFAVSTASYSNSNNSIYCAIDAAALRYYTSEVALNPDLLSDEIEGETLRRSGELYTALHALGYNIYQVSSHPVQYPAVTELLPQPLQEKLMVSTTVEGLSILDLTREMSVLSAFSQMFGNGTKQDNDTFSTRLFNASFRSRVLRVFDYYDDPQNICFRDRTALFSYVLCPHTPFIFRADGSEVSSAYRRDWDDPSHYAEQHAYMTARTKSVIESILSVDPNAVIILQSDHGVRGGLFVGHGLEVELDDQRRIFNAVYFGGEPVEIEGLTAVDTLRYVLTQLGGDYPPLGSEGVVPLYYSDQMKAD